MNEGVVDLPWTEGQLEALALIEEWWDMENHRPFILQGYAGTGKTTLVKKIIEKFHEDNLSTRLIAPTGKASRVLHSKTQQPTSTVHRFIYKPVTGERDRLKNVLRDLVLIEQPSQEVFDSIKEIDEQLRAMEIEGARFTSKPTDKPNIAFCDETSMLGLRAGRDLERLNVPLIYCGDPFQLKPVRDTCIWEGRNPDIVLKEVVRQRGEGAGIAIAANRLREGLSYGDEQGFHLATRGEIKWENYLDFDIILCGTNALRRKINQGIRKIKKIDNPLPEPGERIISLWNNYEYDIWNGEVFEVKRVVRTHGNIAWLDIQDQYGRKVPYVPCWAPIFGDDSETSHAPSGLNQFTFGYAITVHKSQGSEWNSVLLLDDWGREDHDRWLYTGITRAVKHCTLVQ